MSGHYSVGYYSDEGNPDYHAQAVDCPVCTAEVSAGLGQNQCDSCATVFNMDTKGMTFVIIRGKESEV